MISAVYDSRYKYDFFKGRGPNLALYIVAPINTICIKRLCAYRHTVLIIFGINNKCYSNSTASLS